MTAMKELEPLCPNCGIRKQQWKLKRGKGYVLDGGQFCCEACANGDGCTCVGEDHRPPDGDGDSGRL